VARTKREAGLDLTVSAALHVTLLAVVAAASPLTLTATLIVIRSERPRIDGIGFLSGYVLGTALACMVGLVVGSAFVDRIDSHDTIEAFIELLAGAALLVVGGRTRWTEPAPQRTGRRTAIMAGLRDMGPAAAFSMAALLGFGGPKRLLFTLLAMASVSGAGDGRIIDAALVVAYVVIATAPVWGPVGFVIVAPDRARRTLERSERWVTANARELRVWLSLALGTALVVDGLVRIFM